MNGVKNKSYKFAAFWIFKHVVAHGIVCIVPRFKWRREKKLESLTI